MNSAPTQPTQLEVQPRPDEDRRLSAGGVGEDSPSDEGVGGDSPIAVGVGGDSMKAIQQIARQSARPFVAIMFVVLLLLPVSVITAYKLGVRSAVEGEGAGSSVWDAGYEIGLRNGELACLRGESNVQTQAQDSGR